MNSREADVLAKNVAESLAAGNSAQAHSLLELVLEQRTPFRLLDRIAAEVGSGQWQETKALLDCIAEGGSEGGWVVIGGVLRQQYARRPSSAFSECRRCIVVADRWYGADILGERVPGPALVQDFDQARTLLAPWRNDSNHWVRRSVGVAVHFWAKRAGGDPSLAERAEILLAFLEPMFGEWEMDAVKGVGWGLKTLGRYYPVQLADWLETQSGRRHRRLMLRKALTYLPNTERDRVMGIYGL
ncbi:MAG: DNA alkylation repair protein [Chloroflexota bacterium]|nr:MAG: DNA alkylation repair protein [Chloroflexota bacterium]